MQNNMKALSLFTLLIVSTACSTNRFHASWTREHSPDSYSARLLTSKGEVDIAVTRAWSPAAADRFYQLVKHHALDGMLFYRVVPNFVAQFGEIDSTVEQRWKKSVMPDEPVLQGNTRGRISFARGGKDSRSIHLFINLKDNNRLDTVFYNDTRGFPAFGEVSQGMAVVDALYQGYSNATMDLVDTLGANRRKFMARFPLLDSIQKASLLK
jgi:peptidyl-prolyl cis-trans isomerase A (cyclophilin A)